MEQRLIKQATKLLEALDMEWAAKREFNLNALKKFSSAQAILKANPDVQIAVARCIIDIIAGFAQRETAKGNKEWYRAKGFPWGCVYFEASLLKRRLPFKDEDLSAMFERVAGIGFISASQFEFLGSLVAALETYAAQFTLSSRLRDAAKAVGYHLLGDGARRLWPPDAADTRAAKRIDWVLSGPLDLQADK